MSFKIVLGNQKFDASFRPQPIPSSMDLPSAFQYQRVLLWDLSSAFSLSWPRDTSAKAQWDEDGATNWAWCPKKHLIISFAKNEGATLNALRWSRARCSRLYRSPSLVEDKAWNSLPTGSSQLRSVYGSNHSQFATCRASSTATSNLSCSTIL